MVRLLVIASPSEAQSLIRILQSDEIALRTLEADWSEKLSQTLGENDLILINAAPANQSGINAIELLRKVRQHSLIPVLIISDAGNEAERVLALEFGADDYLHKPYSHQELVARVRAILRRTLVGVSAFRHLLKVRDFELDKLQRKVRRGGEEIALTSAEFDLLEMFLQRAGQTVTREEIAQSILGRPLNHNDRSIDMHVSNLRRKLGGSIKAIRGVGYSFAVSMEKKEKDPGTFFGEGET
jgi:DNA-binding response OmpR family regulator